MARWERPAELNVVVGGARHDGPAGANLFVGQLPESWDDKVRGIEEPIVLFN